jgi:hypothetical protein
MVEFALTTLLLVGVIVAIIDGARWISTYFALAHAAAQGVRVGAFVPRASWPIDDIDAKIRIATRSALPGWIELAAEDIVICRRQTSASECDAAGTAQLLRGTSTVEVTVTHTFQWFPYAGAWLGQVADEITAFHREHIE